MKRVLITGANSGFGYLTALKFARKGWYVFATSRDLASEGVTKMNNIASKERLNVQWIQLDITDPKEVKDAIKKLDGNLDVLVNNAGYGLVGPMETLKMDEIEKQMDTNFLGTVRMCKAVLPMMREKGSGKIINISSISGLVPAPMYSIYSASKHALEALSEALRYEVAQFGISVSLVQPGSFNTSFGKNMNGLQKERVKDTPYNEYVRKLKRLRGKVDYNKLLGPFRFLNDPQRVADKIYAVANRSNSKLRNIVGLDAHLIALLRKILPSSVWTWTVSMGK